MVVVSGDEIDLCQTAKMDPDFDARVDILCFPFLDRILSCRSSAFGFLEAVITPSRICRCMKVGFWRGTVVALPASLFTARHNIQINRLYSFATFPNFMIRLRSHGRCEDRERVGAFVEVVPQ